MGQLVSTCFLFLMYVEPPITSAILLNYNKGIDPNKYYEMLCLGCHKEWLFVPIYIATVLIAVGGFLIIGWVLYASCKKFARDGA